MFLIVEDESNFHLDAVFVDITFLQDAHYDAVAGIFLALVAIPSIFGEMAFTVWLLAKGGKVSGSENN